MGFLFPDIKVSYGNDGTLETYCALEGLHMVLLIHEVPS